MGAKSMAASEIDCRKALVGTGLGHWSFARLGLEKSSGIAGPLFPTASMVNSKHEQCSKYKAKLVVFFLTPKFEY